MPKYESIKIYLPPSLKKKMDQHPHINWSKVAQQAFEKAVALSERIEKELN